MRISFVGDVSFTGNFGKVVKDPDSSRCIFAPEVSEIFENSDYTVCNLEGPLTERKCVLSTMLNVKSPFESLPFLLEHKINVFGLANNHMFDAEYGGYKDTVEALNARDAIYFGAGNDIHEASKIIYLENKDVTISLIAVGHDTGQVADENKFGIFSYAHEEILKKRIKEARNSSDWVVLFYHTGPEYNFFPTPVVRDRLIKTLDFDVDIIVAHHPHVMQGIECFENNKAIIYSLGNFIFDLVSSRSKKDADIGLISTIVFTKENYSIENVPTKINPIEGQITLADDSYKEKLVTLSNFDNYEKKMLKDSLRVMLFNPLLPSKFGLKYVIFILFLPLIFIAKMHLQKGAAREYLDYTLEYFKIPFMKSVFGKDENYRKL